jgi:hypothetical protein
VIRRTLPESSSGVAHILGQAHDRLQRHQYRIRRQHDALGTDHFDPLNLPAVKALEEVSFHRFRHADAARQPGARQAAHIRRLANQPPGQRGLPPLRALVVSQVVRLFASTRIVEQ